MLWVGAAALPLRNITRVEALRLKPFRGTFFVRFLKWLAITVLAYVLLDEADVGDARIGESGSPVILAAAIGLAVFLLTELFRPKRPVLAVETAGGSLVVVTLPTLDELRVVAGQIVHAIDHPEAEFTADVHQLNNHNGDVIHQHGKFTMGKKP
ncbi:DUF6232 family protein [Streptomyces sp. NPDC056503]|uniref:DUF6232 family protein n=1 Tax=Streptomyces sp. NPDC056503 TaxID=3345842 RepID=UPI0036AD18F9